MASAVGTNAPPEAAHRVIFRRIHAHHASCAADEWLNEPCRSANGKPLDRPVVWSRRNGPWHKVDVLWIGAAPGNAGRRGRGELGAHGTRIPFGGDVAGANLEVLLSTIGLDRNRTFIMAALNQLPESGGGEPSSREILAPCGEFESSVEVARDSILAAGPRLIVCLGNVAARVTTAATSTPPMRALPSIPALGRTGWRRGETLALTELNAVSPAFREAWASRWSAPLPVLLWLTHPSAQNMSPFAGAHTAFHRRMRETCDSLRRSVRTVLGITPPDRRGEPPDTGIYGLPEWRDRVAPRNAQLDNLWRQKGV